MSAFVPEPIRFWQKVNKTNECWLWIAGRYGRNREYGCFYTEGGRRATPAHRWAWEQENGPVPEGLVLDHLCRTTLCVRPDHLEPVTHQVNILRGEGLAAKQAKQTHCKRGHSLEDAHLLSRNRRDCRQCRQMRNASRSKDYRALHG